MGHVKADGAVETRKLASHQGRAHKLALDPGQGASFYSCGEDGAVRHFDLREPGVASRKLLLCRASRHGQVGERSVITYLRRHFARGRSQSVPNPN